MSIEVIRKIQCAEGNRLFIAAATRTLSACRARGLLTLVLTGDVEMRELNTRYRRRRRTTDVLAFPGYDRRPFALPRGARHLGDVVISIPEARREARKKGITLSDELRMLVVHGVLHCLGYDHERPVDAIKMLPLQEKILRFAR